MVDGSGTLATIEANAPAPFCNVVGVFKEHEVGEIIVQIAIQVAEAIGLGL